MYVRNLEQTQSRYSEAFMRQRLHCSSSTTKFTSAPDVRGSTYRSVQCNLLRVNDKTARSLDFLNMVDLGLVPLSLPEDSSKYIYSGSPKVLVVVLN